MTSSWFFLSTREYYKNCNNWVAQLLKKYISVLMTIRNILFVMICVAFSSKKIFVKCCSVRGMSVILEHKRREFYFRESLLIAMRCLGLKHTFRIWNPEHNCTEKVTCMIVMSDWCCWIYLIIPDGTTFNKVKVLHTLPQWLNLSPIFFPNL